MADGDAGHAGGQGPAPQPLTTPFSDDGAADDDAASGAGQVQQVQITEAGRSDADEVVALWHSAGLTRPWNDPEADFEQARTGPVSAVLIARPRAPHPAAQDPGEPDTAVQDPGEPRSAERHRAELRPADPDPEAWPDAGPIVASAMVGVDGHRGWIYYFATHPGVRAAGHGAALLTACEEWLAAHGAPKAQLMVRRGNPAASFYTRHGYTEQDVVVLGRRLAPGGAPP